MKREDFEKRGRGGKGRKCDLNCDSYLFKNGKTLYSFNFYIQTYFNFLNAEIRHLK